MNKKTITGLGATLLASAAVAQSGSPNYIFILLDDVGWSSLSIQMDKNVPDSRSDFFQTPNMDRLVSQGMRFSSGYAAAAISSPTRYSIQTGKTPARVNHVRVGQNTDHIDHAAILSIPKILKSTNPAYSCAHFGKWHLGCEPSVMGYEFSDGPTSNMDGNRNVISRTPPPGYTPKNKQDTWLNINISKDPKAAFSITDRSVAFLEQCAKDKRPFYLQISHYAMHKEITSTRESFDKFNALPRGSKHTHATFAAMVWDTDTAIGRVVAKLHELGMADNTYIILMADNGGAPILPPNVKKLMEEKGGLGENAPLQRGKWDLYEGGIRVIYSISGPGIAPNSQSDIPAVSYDILPTIAELSGYKKALPSDIDGVSLSGALLGKGRLSERALYFHNPFKPSVGVNRPHSAIRVGDWKVIEFLDDGQRELYDLRNDIGEAKDLSQKDKKRTAALGKRLDDYLASVNALKYDPNVPTQQVGGVATHPF